MNTILDYFAKKRASDGNVNDEIQNQFIQKVNRHTLFYEEDAVELNAQLKASVRQRDLRLPRKSCDFYTRMKELIAEKNQVIGGGELGFWRPSVSGLQENSISCGYSSVYAGYARGAGGHTSVYDGHSSVSPGSTRVYQEKVTIGS